MSNKNERNLVSERAQYLLKALVERYIQDGHPVGSKTLAQQFELQLSPATIRNVMAELEERGYIRSVHTSSGRVPTEQGYRLFVDSLLTIRPIDETEVVRLQFELEPSSISPAALVQSVSRLLSNITHLAGVVTLPKREHFILRHVEFLPLSQRRVLVILVTHEAEVQNRIIQCERDYTKEELVQAANYFNTEFTGHELVNVRERLIASMKQDKVELDVLMQRVLDLSKTAFNIPEEQDCVVQGGANLLEVMDTTATQKIRALLDAFTHKQEMLHFFDQCLRADGIQIFIGAESGMRVFEECALVTAPYRTGGTPVGVLGVIGPTRMAYERVIPLVDVTARLVSVALTRASSQSGGSHSVAE